MKGNRRERVVVHFEEVYDIDPYAEFLIAIHVFKKRLFVHA